MHLAASIEARAPLSAQLSWDNSGWQVAPDGLDEPCRGVMLCLDVTPAVVDEAVARDCNLIISHHPLIFRGLKSIVPQAAHAEEAIVKAIRAGIAVYSSHTALDVSPVGPSAWLAGRLGLRLTEPLDPETYIGIIGELPEPLSHKEFLQLVSQVYGGGIRHTPGPGREIKKVALCSGSGGEFITWCIAQGVDAYITSDVRYHDFLDHGTDLMIVDTGHFESEICTKSIFKEIICEKFPNFAVHMSQSEHAPVKYSVDTQEKV